MQNILLYEALFKDRGRDCTFTDGKGLEGVWYTNTQTPQSSELSIVPEDSPGCTSHSDCHLVQFLLEDTCMTVSLEGKIGLMRKFAAASILSATVEQREGALGGLVKSP